MTCRDIGGSLAWLRGWVDIDQVAPVAVAAFPKKPVGAGRAGSARAASPGRMAIDLTFCECIKYTSQPQEEK
jgi:hypothetical protein